MLRIKAIVAPSKLYPNTVGLFSGQHITKGAITWCYDRGLDQELTQQQLDRLPPPMKDFFIFYAYYDPQREIYVCPIDHQRFIVHNDKTPNIESSADQDIAARDIMPGEELTCDFNQFDPGYFRRLKADVNNISKTF